MTADIGFCVVGLGMGANRAEQITKTAGARLVSVVDSNVDRAEEIGRKLGCKFATHIDEALGDNAVDVVFVLTPSGLHGDLTIRALDAGKNAITTKPMEISVEKCDDMIVAQRQSGKLLGVDFECRYTDDNQMAKFAMGNGLLGKPVLGEARLKWYRSQSYYDAGGWRGTWAMDGGGALANQSIHWIDMLQWVMGPAKRIWGRIATATHSIETEDLGMAMIEFASGAQGGILGTTTHPANTMAGLEIHGSEGAFLNTRSKPEWIFLEGLENRKEQLQRVTSSKNVIEDMVSALTRGTPLVCDGENGRESTALLNAIYRSAKQDGAPVLT